MDSFFSLDARPTPSVHVASAGRDVPASLVQAVQSLAARTTHSLLDDIAGSDGLTGAPDVLVLLLGGSGPADPTRLINFAQEAERIHCPVILSASLEEVDHVPEPLWSSCQSILVDPDATDFAASLAAALSQRPGLLSDVSRDVDSARLQRLADEVGRIARTLANLSASAPEPHSVADMRPGFFDEPLLASSTVSAREIRGMIRLRRLRDRYFESSLFADPAWDMLLDLMAARLERVQVAVSSLCIAACVPPTTALRWIKVMTENGLFERVADPADGRRIFIRLSGQATQAMTRLLTAMGGASERLV